MLQFFAAILSVLTFPVVFALLFASVWDLLDLTQPKEERTHVLKALKEMVTK